MKAREIQLGDLRLALKIIKKIGIRNVLADIGTTDVSGVDPEQVSAITKERGIQIAMTLLENAADVPEIFELFAAWFDCPVSEFDKISIRQVPQLVDDFLSVNATEELKAFFQRAVSSLT